MPIFPAQAAKSIDDLLVNTMGEGRNIYRNNIIKNKEIKNTFDKFAQTLYNPQNIKIASRAAYEAMSEEQRQRYTLLEDGACILKEDINAKEPKEFTCAS